jgi:hypothetical protein
MLEEITYALAGFHVVRVLVVALLFAVIHRWVMAFTAGNRCDRNVEKSAANFLNKIASPLVYVRRLLTCPRCHYLRTRRISLKYEHEGVSPL